MPNRDQCELRYQQGYAIAKAGQSRNRVPRSGPRSEINAWQRGYQDGYAAAGRPQRRKIRRFEVRGGIKETM